MGRLSITGSYEHVRIINLTYPPLSVKLYQVARPVQQGGFALDNRVYIFDTTLRDGEQSPGCSMNTPEKLRMARMLVDLGVDILEAGFPIASDGDFEAVRAIAKEFSWVQVAALARTTPLDIERAAAALEPARRPRIHTFIAT